MLFRSTASQFRPLKFGVTRVQLRDGVPGTHYMAAEQALQPYPDRLSDRLRHWAEQAPERTFMARRVRQADGTLGYSPNLRHGVTGKGLNDYPTIFRILAEHNYRGWVSIEDGMNGLGEMAESLAFLRSMGERFFPS